ncbi:MAG: hypothetical protein EXR75_02660 [Myxococcales bacterium]|nr:hypothetical protein [Myxococcales bacterium]
MNVNEFEAILGQVLATLNKTLYENGSNEVLEEGRRTVESVIAGARESAKLKALRGKLDKATDAVCGVLAKDGALRDDLWDCLDYIDYRA